MSAPWLMKAPPKKASSWLTFQGSKDLERRFERAKDITPKPKPAKGKK